MANNFNNIQSQQNMGMQNVSAVDQLFNVQRGGTPISNLKKMPEMQIKQQQISQHNNQYKYDPQIQPQMQPQQQIQQQMQQQQMQQQQMQQQQMQQQQMQQQQMQQQQQQQTPRKQPSETGSQNKGVKLISRLVKDINSSIKEYNNDDNVTTDNTTENENEPENDNSTIPTLFISMFKEAILIILIYVILSQGFIKRTLGLYITQINPVDGSIPFIGYIIYGTLLAILFIIAKQLLPQ